MSKGIKVRIAVDVAGVTKAYTGLSVKIPKILRKAATQAGQAGAKEAKAKAPIRDIAADKKSIRKRGLLVKRKGRYRILKLKKTDEGKIQVSSTYRGGLLRKALHYKVKQYRKGKIMVAIVGVRPGFRTQIGIMTRGSKPQTEMTRAKVRKAGTPIFADPVKYIHLIDRGTRDAAAIPIIEPASKVGAQVAKDIASKELDTAINEMANA